MPSAETKGRSRKLYWVQADALHGGEAEREGETAETLAALDASVARRGILQPILIDSLAEARRTIIAGRRRWRAAVRAGHSHVPCYVADDLAPRERQLAEYEENACRLDLTPSEAARVMAQLRPLLEAEARERQEASRPKTGQKIGAKQPRAQGAPKLGAPSGKHRGEVRSQLGKAVGLGPETVRKIEAIQRAAEANPKVYGCLLKLMDQASVDAAYQQLRAWQGADDASRASAIEPSASPPGPPATVKRVEELADELLALLRALATHGDGMSDEAVRRLVDALEPVAGQYRALADLLATL